ncbi:alpha/beta hydrolase [Catellatospora sp. NPDC049133]|uniref:alpha/beta hydrolase n=1 Tax=Catellatospora sp. NPDC049133 TaxID=3155499 RepID=UPI0033C7484D
MTLRGNAAGVPYIALPPADPTPDTPLVVAWHLLDPPRSEIAMAAALPLSGLNAWRVYLGLPMTGDRMLPGGPDELMKLVMEDAVLNLFEPLTRQAVAEFPPALAELRSLLDTRGPLSLLGGSIGSMTALRLLTETAVEVDRVALVSPAVQLSALVDANSRMFGMPYRWTDESRAAADRLDFVARAAEIERPVLMVVGDEDDRDGFRDPAQRLWAALPEGSSLVAIPGMGHALAEEPGIEAAPQTAHAAQVDAIVTDWLSR